MTVSPLTRVRRAAEKAAKARGELEAAIVAANRSGRSLRGIAEAAGLSHETVRTIIERGRKR